MKSVVEYLDQAAETFREKIAVSFKDEEVTFEELRNIAMSVGTSLATFYGDTRNGVAVFMDKSLDALCAFLGSLYSGNFYSMINPELPEERIAKMLEKLEAKCIVTNDDNYARALELASNEIKVFNIKDLMKSEIDVALLTRIRSKSLDVDPVYCNFTSGSTGTPKGVLINHRSVIDFTNYFTDIFNITSEDIIANQAPFDFDVSVKDIYSSLKTGAKLVIIPKELFSQPANLVDALVDNKITTMTWAVSALCLITTFHGLDYKVPETVNKILFSGEAMPLKHLKQWMEHLPEATFVNLYGPTEITCNCTYHIIDRNREYEKLPIGNAFPNEEIILLDGDELVSEGEVEKLGEICVRGTALALGYINALPETDSRFVRNPLNKMYPDMIYRTGDMGYYSADGELFFAGRKDFQVKYMGHRIELEEIEQAMNKVEGVTRSCVIFNEEKSKLTGYYVGTIDKKELHRTLKERMPIFMVPGAIRQIEEMPMTKNGKIDRRKVAEIKK